MTETLQERVARLKAAGFAPDRQAMVVKGEYRYVAVIGVICDWAAYKHYYWMTQAEVAARGDKISKEEARRLFPEFAELHYRS